MWREISFKLLLAPSCGPADDTSSDDDDHNTSNVLLLLCADALIAPVLLAGLSDLDELKVALGCRLALDVFNIAQQDYPVADQEPVICDPWPAALRGLLVHQPSARVDAPVSRLGSLADSDFCEGFMQA